MIVAVTGRRTYRLTPADITWLNDLHRQDPFTELWEGGESQGADYACRLWGKRQGIWVVTCWPNWTGKGRAGSTLRQGRLLDKLVLAQHATQEPMALLAFPGNAGTRSAVTHTVEKHIPIMPSPTAPWGREARASPRHQEALWTP